MEIQEIRKKNINDLCEHYGRDVVARKMGYPDTVYINQLCAGHSNCGSKTARKVEEAFGLENGFMDVIHANENPNLSRHIEKLTEILSRASPEKCEEIVRYAQYQDRREES